MINNLKKKSNKKKGFTLIELIIVIAILAILAAVAVPQFGKIRENANKSTDIANGKTITNAISTLLAEDKLTLPTSDTGATIILNGVNDDTTLDGMTAPEATDKTKDIDTTITEYLQSVPTAKLSSVKGKNFTVKISKSGSIIVAVDNEQVYPEPASATSSAYYK